MCANVPPVPSPLLTTCLSVISHSSTLRLHLALQGNAVAGYRYTNISYSLRHTLPPSFSPLQGWVQATTTGSEWRYCSDHFLNQSVLRTMSDLRLQFAELLWDIGFIGPSLQVRRSC